MIKKIVKKVDWDNLELFFVHIIIRIFTSNSYLPINNITNLHFKKYNFI